MRKEASLPIRLDTDTKHSLQNIADIMGLTVSALIRMLVKSFAKEYDLSGGKVAIPPQWESSVICQETQKNG